MEQSEDDDLCHDWWRVREEEAADGGEERGQSTSCLADWNASSSSLHRHKEDLEDLTVQYEEVR